MSKLRLCANFPETLTPWDQTTLILGMDLAEIAKYLYDEWQRDQCFFHGKTWEAELSITYDHDYEFHIVLIVHPTGARSFHAMFYVGTESACLVKQWDTTFPANLWIESAEIVQGWSELAAAVCE